MTCLELDSNTEDTEGEGPVWAEVSESESATPLERSIWEDVVFTASCAEALSRVVGLCGRGRAGMVIGFGLRGIKSELSNNQSRI